MFAPETNASENHQLGFLLGQVRPDSCPDDVFNDGDGDGICAREDSCPGDAMNDQDGDGLCTRDDACRLLFLSIQPVSV